jgi:acetyl esterase/lipase
MPSPEMQSVIQMLRSRPARDDLTVAELRAAFEMFPSLFPAAEDVQSERVDAGGVPAEWITVPESSAEATVYWLHGGGYVIGSISTHRDLVSRIARAAGARALAPEYRLAPEHPFPAAVDDAVAAYRWLLKQGIDPARLIIGGDSAGGGLAVAALLSLIHGGDPLPAAAVLISPWLDLEGAGESMTSRADLDPMIQRDGLLKMAAMYHGETDARHPLVSPVHADLAGLPPMLVQVGDWETLLDDSRRLAERAQAAGVDVTLEVWDEMIHVWHFFAATAPESRRAIERVGRYIRERVTAAREAAQKPA